MMRFRYVSYCTVSDVRDNWRNKADGDRSENGRGAWVALCAHPTHTDIDKRSTVINIFRILN
jgi:hypothetical protein